MQVTKTEKKIPLMVLIQLAPAIVMTPRHHQNTNSLKKVTCGTESLYFWLDVPCSGTRHWISFLFLTKQLQCISKEWKVFLPPPPSPSHNLSKHNGHCCLFRNRRSSGSVCRWHQNISAQQILLWITILPQ